MCVLPEKAVYEATVCHVYACVCVIGSALNASEPWVSVCECWNSLSIEVQ